MSRIVAIFAHFDPDCIVDDNALAILQTLSRVCEKVDFITTSPVELAKVGFPERVSARRRPNIGYDFYSYKSGLFSALNDPEVDHIFLVNSSFVVLDPKRFETCLQQMLQLAQSEDVVGASISHQMGRHVQSYLMLLGPAAIKSQALVRYVNAIQPQSSKIDLILNYELGLSQTLNQAGLKLAAVFEPPLTASDAANPVHANADELARATGIIKTEVLRDNQHAVDLEFVQTFATAEALTRAEALIARYRQHYVVGGDRMTALKSADRGPPALRYARWGQVCQPGVRIAVAAHMFYSDLAEEFCSYLSNIVEPFDLFVTTPFEKDVPQLINGFARVASSVTIAVSENRGRDIGPFIALLRSGQLDVYPAVLKLHSKKSRYSDAGDLWRKTILGALIGTSYKALQSVDLLLRSDVGMVGPHDYYLTDPFFLGGNRKKLDALLASLPGASQNTPGDLGFFAGSMFWFRPEALRHFQHLQAFELDFEPENGAQDGTLAHAVERAFGPVVRAEGFRTSSIYLNGKEIHDTPTRTNRVPVLGSTRRD